MQKADFTDVLKDLMHENAILVINKSDLLEKDIDQESLKKLKSCFNFN